MDISNATALASAIVALVAPALVQAFKKYIPGDYVGLVSLGSSIILGVIAVGATGGFNHATWGSDARRSGGRLAGRVRAGQSGIRRQAQQGSDL